MIVKYILKGLVQGIGFRPYVKREADKLKVLGIVKNCGGYVEIYAKADEDTLKEFKNRILDMEFSKVTDFKEETASDMKFNDFKIVKSEKVITKNPIIAPDIATCKRCIDEMYDKNNRRYMHPFISCTDCGPRYSIIDALPYDRENITMSDFLMCDECGSEYKDIKDVRCHAQTIACNNCGPKLFYTVDGDPIYESIKTIKNDGIVAIKDIGGYHFACLLNSDKAIEKLRNIKGRKEKPFAVMFNSVDEIKEYAKVNKKEEEILISDIRPIVLLSKKKPLLNITNNDRIGAFLPSNPVQEILTKECGPLIMTSGNVSEEPIITEDDKIKELRDKFDFEILWHNRRILTPLDDSICEVVSSKMRVIRRARGYTPMPLKISGKNLEILAMGGDLKASFCLVKDSYAYMSQYFGDLENADCYRIWEDNIQRMKSLFNINPQKVISDLHPLYYSSNYKDNSVKLQHHYAHMAAVMAEKGLQNKVLGFVFDGTGCGEDGNVWGGEVILYDNGFKRVLHLDYIKLLGGDESAKDADKTYHCYLIASGINDKNNNPLIKAAIENDINTVKTSSMGRLFDAVSAMLGICKYNTYEGECAIKLETIAGKAKKAYPLLLREENGVWDTKRFIKDMYNALKTGMKAEEIALGFHYAIINAVCQYAINAGVLDIVLSGGVFANRILINGCCNELKKLGFNVYFNEEVPTNDSGIALGQAWYLLNRTEE